MFLWRSGSIISDAYIYIHLGGTERGDGITLLCFFYMSRTRNSLVRFAKYASCHSQTAAGSFLPVERCAQIQFLVGLQLLSNSGGARDHPTSAIFRPRWDSHGAEGNKGLRLTDLRISLFFPPHCTQRGVHHSLGSSTICEITQTKTCLRCQCRDVHRTDVYLCSI